MFGKQSTIFAKGRLRAVMPLLFSLVALWYATSALAAPPSGVFAFGANVYGELGDGTTINHTAAVPTAGYGVTGTLTKILSVAGGSYHSLALSSDGTVWSYGYNSNGQLGDGTTVDRTKPVHVIDSSGNNLNIIIAVAAGEVHSLALTADGHVYAWGGNSVGQLGDGTTTERAKAVFVPGLSNVIAIAAGLYHSLALTADGKVYAWGYNSNGQLGQGSHDFDAHPTPTLIPGLNNMKAISGGFYHSLALRADGTVQGWGANAYGQLGDGTTTDRNSPVSMLFAAGFPLTGVMNIAAGGYHSVLRYYGFVYTVGYNAYGQLGDGTTTNRLFPVSTGFGSVSSIAAGSYHTLALKQGAAYGCGYNVDGELGDGTTVSRTALTAAASFGTVAAIAGGGLHTLAVRADTDATGAAFGYNAYGQLGDGTLVTRNAPVTVMSGSGAFGDVLRLAGGGSHSLALTANGGVWAWGDNNVGQLGDGTLVSHSTPKPVPGLPPIVAVSAGATFSMALAADGTVWTWGDNVYGQIGNGPKPAYSPSPVMVPNLAGIIAIAAGGNFALALRVDGAVLGWGFNGNGELADGTNINRNFPVLVGTPPLMKAIAAGQDYGLAIDGSGEVWTWGYNFYGQLGDTTTTGRNYVKAVFSPAKAIAGGVNHSLLLRSDGLVFATGYNGSGQLGDGTFTDHAAFQLVPNLKNNTAIAAGNNHSLTRLADGTASAWGDDLIGELGDSLSVNRPVPGPVSGLADVRDIAAGFLHSLVIAPVGASLSGTLTFEGINTTVGHNQTVTFLLVPTDGSPRFTRILSVPATGEFTLTDVPHKSYTIWIKGDKYLADLVTADATASDVSGLASFQPTGDADNNNIVDLGDFGILVNSYLAVPGDPEYDERADFTDEGIVDLGDFGLLVNNFLVTGAPVP